MGKLIFYYGTMGCSKTANALMTRFQFLERDKKVLLIKPSTDTRDDRLNSDGSLSILIKSRIGIEAEAFSVKSDTDIIGLWKMKSPDIIICDEAQFLTPLQVELLKNISEYIDVICYGLRTDFRTNVFPGSLRLFELADRLIELESICDCGKPSLVNARIDTNGNVVTDGDQVEIGGNDKYKPMCWACWRKAINANIG